MLLVMPVWLLLLAHTKLKKVRRHTWLLKRWSDRASSSTPMYSCTKPKKRLMILLEESTEEDATGAKGRSSCTGVVSHALKTGSSCFAGTASGRPLRGGWPRLVL